MKEIKLQVERGTCSSVSKDLSNPILAVSLFAFRIESDYNTINLTRLSNVIMSILRMAPNPIVCQ
jgi:hypothetical protein